MSIEQKYCVQGYDAFSHEYYDLGGEYDDAVAARQAALNYLVELEVTQPSLSGGQDFFGMQDRVYVLHPDGAKYRVM